ncbi:MAG: dockerin type I repeat-containing protein [Planctomycetota bacterium]
MKACKLVCYVAATVWSHGFLAAQPANDSCTAPQVVGIGMPAAVGSVAAASNDGTSGCGSAATNPDVWFSFSVPVTGSYTFDTCGTHDAPGIDQGMDTVLTVFDTCGGLELACNDDHAIPACNGFDSSIRRDSSVTLTLSGGSTVLIRISHFGALIANGEFILNVSTTATCGDLGSIICSYDCMQNLVSVSFDIVAAYAAGYTGLRLLENGVVVATVTVVGASTIQHSPTVGGLNTYTIEWSCPLGDSGTTGSCSLYVAGSLDLSPFHTDLIIGKEGGGLVSSATQLRDALLDVGRVAIQANLFLDFGIMFNQGCLDLMNVQTVWVMLGTFPDDNRLSLLEANTLAAWAASGVGIYLESGDHWGFQHLVSDLDLRDGIDAIGSLDGDDDLLALNGANASVAGLDLSSLSAVPYTQDQLGNDWTDRLAVTGGDAPDVTSAEVIWTQAGVGYNVGVIALHSDGTLMISQSWEFGGYGGDQSELALAYLEALGRSGGGFPLFLRGDSNGDGLFNIADAVYLLASLFPGGNPPTALSCRDASDSNDDGTINIADAVAILAALFGSTTVPLPDPFFACGFDFTADLLDCASYASCP